MYQTAQDGQPGSWVKSVKRRLTSTDHEEHGITQEPNNLHSLPAVKLVVDQKGSEVVSTQTDTYVDHVPVPRHNDITGRVRADNLNESGGEELVTIEQEVVEEPTQSGTNQTTSKMSADKLERMKIVAGLVDSHVLLGTTKSGRRVLLLVKSEVGEPKSHHSHNAKRNSVSPLSRDRGVRRVARMVENEEKDN